MVTRRFRWSMLLCSLLALLYFLQFKTYYDKECTHAAEAHKIFHVNSIGLVNDNLELRGFERNYDQPRNMDDKILTIEGLTDFINKVKPQILSDDKLVKVELSKHTYFKGTRRVETCSCDSILANNKSEILRARTLSRKRKHSDNDLVEATKNCPQYIEDRGYITDPLTEAENEFPIAFSILMFKEAEQCERLLRAIYRPQNVYCIHVDKKTKESTYKAMSSIANCFDNVFMASARTSVTWGDASVIEPDLQCMSDLFHRGGTWKYFINLTGQEFPLRTNYELVQILKAFDGANDIAGTLKRSIPGRWKTAGPPPHNITPIKGGVHIVASRGFVNYTLNDQKAKDFWNWSKKTAHPDEVFFNSLNHNPHLGVPGSYKGEPETFPIDANSDKPSISRFKNWQGNIFGWKCHGKWARSICIMGVGDLPYLTTRKELFVNKLHYDFEPMAYDCLEEWHLNQTRDIYLGTRSFDAKWYGNVGFVKNKV